MRIAEAASLVEAALKLKESLLLVGAPGIGKTEVGETAARRLEMDCIAICTPLVDPPFILGYPYRENGKAGHLAYGPMYRALTAEKPTVLFWDEFGGASESVQKCALRLFQFREVGDKKLPDHVVMMAASNDVGHNAGVMGIFGPLKDRFASIINCEPHIDDTVTYALAHDWPVDLIAFLRNAPDALLDYTPQRSMQPDGATPRGWGVVARWVNNGVTDPEVIAGKVGQGRATQYLAYRKLMAELPDIDEVLLNPGGAAIPENPAAKWFVSAALAAKVNCRNFGSVWKYLDRIQDSMFEAFCFQGAIKAEAVRIKDGNVPANYQKISSSRDFIKWAHESEVGKTVAGKE